MSVAEGDFPTWIIAMGSILSIFFTGLTGAVGAAWHSNANFRTFERRMADKFDEIRDRQDELHRENKADLQRLEDRLTRRPR